VSPSGVPGTNSQNPATTVVGSNTLANLTNSQRYKVFVNSPNLIHLTPLTAVISLGSTQVITTAQTTTTVTVNAAGTVFTLTGCYLTEMPVVSATLGELSTIDITFVGGSYTAV
jgi:hypothetical protein